MLNVFLTSYFVMLATLSLSLVVLRPHTEKKKFVPLFKVSHLRDTPYTLFILGKLSVACYASTILKLI
jgi:hypothetical protein